MDASYLDLVMAQQEESLEEAEGGGGVWIIVDLLEGSIAPVTLEAVGAARTLADSLGAYVYAILLGDAVAALAETLYQAGADGVRVLQDPILASFAVEPYSDVLCDLFEEELPEIILLGASSAGQALAPRVAQRLGGGLIEHVTAVGLNEATLAVEVTIPVYGGEYFDIRTCPEARPQLLTIEPGAFVRPFLDVHRRGEPTVRDVKPGDPAVRVLGPAERFHPPEVDLSDAAVVVAAGRQAGDFRLVERLAQTLGAQLAGDRGARDAGWIDSERVVDVREVTVSPDVYVAVGVRGDTFHNAAAENAQFVVAIHPDGTAPIFRMADLCVVGDPEEVVVALLDALS